MQVLFALKSEILPYFYRYIVGRGDKTITTRKEGEKNIYESEVYKDPKNKGGF